MPIDVLIAKRRSNVAPNLRDNFHDAPIVPPFANVKFFLAR